MESQGDLSGVIPKEKTPLESPLKIPAGLFCAILMSKIIDDWLKSNKSAAFSGAFVFHIL